MTTRLASSEIEMIETTGTLNLKIAQLEQRLKVLKQQQVLSGAYPAHRTKLVEEDWRVQRQLQQLWLRRQMLSQSVTGLYTERPCNDETGARKRSFYQAA